MNVRIRKALCYKLKLLIWREMIKFIKTLSRMIIETGCQGVGDSLAVRNAHCS